MRLSHDIKILTLGALIALAAALRMLPAHAGQSETLTVAGGCFWCVEADFESVPGVTRAVSGYTGGDVDNPTYKQVTRGGTGHYEAVQITFDPARVTRRQLLDKFLRSVDPNDADGPFCDRGNSYRTAIFVSDKAERAIAQQAVADARAALGQPIVTPILPQSRFWPAEEYHQDYYKKDELIFFSRFGPTAKRKAYKMYREACGRDARVRELWGDAAPFAGS